MDPMELEACIDVIGRINKFDPEKIKKALDKINFWKSEVCIGMEGSPTIYVIEMDSGEFRNKCIEFARIASADECEFVKTSARTTCRIWWD